MQLLCLRQVADGYVAGPGSPAGVQVLIGECGEQGRDLGDRDPFSWLCQLAEQRIIDAHRKLVAAQKRSADREVQGPAHGADTQRGGFIDLIVASMTTPSGALSRDQREFRLLEALKNLPEESQTAAATPLRRGPPVEGNRQSARADRRRDAGAAHPLPGPAPGIAATRQRFRQLHQSEGRGLSQSHRNVDSLYPLPPALFPRR